MPAGGNCGILKNEKCIGLKCMEAAERLRKITAKKIDISCGGEEMRGHSQLTQWRQALGPLMVQMYPGGISTSMYQYHANRLSQEKHLNWADVSEGHLH